MLNANEYTINYNRGKQNIGLLYYNTHLDKIYEKKFFSKKDTAFSWAYQSHLFQQKPTPHVSNIEQKFYKLKDLWLKEIGVQSSITKIILNHYYLRIMALGESVLPIILKDLQKEPAPWFVALEAITGEKNIGKSTPGNFQAIADEWINWGKEHGLI